MDMAFVIVKYVMLGIPGILLIWLILSSAVNVGPNEVVVLERRFIGKKMQQGRIIASKGEIGIEAKVLEPKFYILPPFLYKIHREAMTKILDGQIGLVESVDGTAIPAGKIFAKTVAGHNTFQNGEAFLGNGGEKGPQIDVIPPGTYRINPYLFKLTPVPVTTVARGQVGLVTAQDGGPIAPGRLLAQSVEGHNAFQDGQAFLTNGGQRGPQIDILLPGTYRINPKLFKVEVDQAVVIDPGKIGLVTSLDGEPLPESEYVAKTIAQHSDYQDGKMFLINGGQRGPQLDVLKPGTYYINLFMFEVETDDVAVVERGQVAVVVSNVGEEPTDEMKKRLGSTQMGATEEQGKEKYVVPKGFRGIQEEVSGPGYYYLNRRAFMPYIIDTTNITIDWDDSKETRFDPLSVISKDGFPIGVSVKVVIRVRPDQSPYMVAKVGGIDNLVNHVIHPMIDSSFRNQASTTSAMAFMQDRQEEQVKAEDRARKELEKYHVECVSVLICQIKLPQELMDTQTKKIIAQQQTSQYVEQQKAEETRIEMMKTKATADQQADLVKAEIAVKVAIQQKLETVTLAEGAAKAAELEGEGKAKAVEAVGSATAEAYEKQKNAIGPTAIMVIEALKQIGAGKIKIVPEILTMGSGSEAGLAAVMTRALSLMPGVISIDKTDATAKKQDPVVKVGKQAEENVPSKAKA